VHIIVANFDRFTERARKVLHLAQEEAQRFNHNYIGTEHILLGLVREGDGVAARVLDKMNVQLPKVRSAVEFIIGRGEGEVIGEIGLTPRAKAVLELAVDEAIRLNHQYVGTEHLLLGNIREGQGIAAGVLESLGVNLATVRANTVRVLSGSEPIADLRRSEPVRSMRWSERDFWIAAAIATGRNARNHVAMVDLLSAALSAADGRALAVLSALGPIPDELAQPDLGDPAQETETSEGSGLRTAAAERAMNLATLASIQLRLQPFESDSLLIGLLDMQEANLMSLLQAAGVSPEQLRSLVILERSNETPPLA
jgi:ATP-dependent Clp protease ATP-binding subunit ClpA